MAELLYKNEVYKIIGCALEVHNELGSGFLEAVYHEAMEIEMRSQNIKFISKPRLIIYYKNFKLKKYYEPDFLIYDKIMVELKTLKHIGVNEKAQIINSIKSSKLRLGLLINFGETSLNWSRYII